MNITQCNEAGLIVFVLNKLMHCPNIVCCS